MSPSLITIREWSPGPVWIGIEVAGTSLILSLELHLTWGSTWRTREQINFQSKRKLTFIFRYFLGTMMSTSSQLTGMIFCLGLYYVIMYDPQVSFIFNRSYNSRWLYYDWNSMWLLERELGLQGAMFPTGFLKESSLLQKNRFRRSHGWISWFKTERWQKDLPETKIIIWIKLMTFH